MSRGLIEIMAIFGRFLTIFRDQERDSDKNGNNQANYQYDG